MPETVESRSPQHPQEVVAKAPEASAAEVAAAAAGAREAQRAWAALAPQARAGALQACAARVEAATGELVELGIREVGKPRTEMAGEVARAVAILRYYAQQVLDPEGELLPAPAGSLLLARRRPHGVAGLITPWNFPLAIPLWKLAPALAYGNGAILKPAPQSLGCALRLGELLAPELPDGLVAILPGDATTGRAVLSEADVVSFTGSVSVGRSVVAATAERQAPVQAEMGGQNPSIVLPDADLGRTAAMVAAAAMGYAGQKCTATSRVVVVGDPAPFTDALVAAVEALALGDPAEQATVVGPVIEERARTAVVEAAEQARRDGGRVLTGGAALEREGWYVAPALVDGLSPDHRLAQEEVFGPIALVLPAADAEEALAIANGVRHGLAAAVFTEDLDAAIELTARLQAGLVKVNAPTSGVDFHAPFGGIKGSGYGPHEQGKAARELYSWVQTLTIARSRA